MNEDYKPSVTVELAEKLFAKMTAKEKANFLSDKMAWARECDLNEELKIRNNL